MGKGTHTIKKFAKTANKDWKKTLKGLIGTKLKISWKKGDSRTHQLKYIKFQRHKVVYFTEEEPAQKDILKNLFNTGSNMRLADRRKVLSMDQNQTKLCKVLRDEGVVE